MNLDNNKYIWIVPFLFAISFVLHFLFAEDEPKLINYYYEKNGDYTFSYLPARDTIFYLGNEYIEISLKEQRARLYRRKDSTLTFKISSGNQYIKEGQSTPDGFFTVQNKTPLAISKQFENAELFNWIGFNGNVGFHGLKGTGYYGSLGIRPASHGCVRISREDGQKLYQKVRVGTAVIVHYHEPLRIIKFSRWKEYNPDRDYMIRGYSYPNYKLLLQRLQNIYRGNALIKNNFRVFHDGKSILRGGFGGIGDISNVPIYQKPILVIKDIKYKTSDNLKKKIPWIVTDTSRVDFR